MSVEECSACPLVFKCVTTVDILEEVEYWSGELLKNTQATSEILDDSGAQESAQRARDIALDAVSLSDVEQRQNFWESLISILVENCTRPLQVSPVELRCQSPYLKSEEQHDLILRQIRFGMYDASKLLADAYPPDEIPGHTF